ncbi:MAG: zinc ribbon domain-containing protein [Clostridiales bacterium]|nr:zinc ribbon domain-containing protein [Clostridiales bacterium]
MIISKKSEDTDMFFVGFFGIDSISEEKTLNISVSECDKPTLIKQYQRFHLFFIPLMKWHEKYYIKCGNGSILEINDVGEKLWSEARDFITDSEFKLIFQEKHCIKCGEILSEKYEYCPKCGQKI